MKFLLENSNKIEYDSCDNPITQEQSAFFAQSKVRTSTGELLLMHHGTDAEFTVFD